jgi:hypothetical protein
MKRWGARPADSDAAKAIIRRDFVTWPKLLPICSHRYLAAEPCASDNPVFSIVGTDMICYGANLAHYLHLEFLRDDHEDYRKHAIDPGAKDIPIWSDFTEMRSDAFVDSYFNR